MAGYFTKFKKRKKFYPFKGRMEKIYLYEYNAGRAG
jgi:hypothetical protein